MDDQSRARANRLYWESEESVGRIADSLGVSRRALYDNIEPVPAGAACPECDGPLLYRNRTAEERGESVCQDCGHEQLLPGTDEPPDDPEAERDHEAARLAPVHRVRNRRAGSGPLLGGAILAGMAVGAAAGYLVRRG
ncbi:MAG TPA: hypothetical protein VK966_11045 [Longimicrobiales bacterium]|nr:hypothetical protein [Longimicrobiales bacterium]